MERYKFTIADLEATHRPNKLGWNRGPLLSAIIGVNPRCVFSVEKFRLYMSSIVRGEATVNIVL